jgi:DNA-binding transcriptional regulator YiaG
MIVMQDTNMNMQICDCCGDELSYGVVPMEVLYGTGPAQVVVVAQVPAWSCATCGDVITAEGAELAEHNAICDHLGRIKPHEIKAIRDEMGLTQSAFAMKMKVGRVTMARWENAAQVPSSGHSESMLSIIEIYRNQNKLNRSYVSD